MSHVIDSTEYMFSSPAPAVPGCKLQSSVTNHAGWLVEVWYAPGGLLFRTCLRHGTEWVPHTVSEVVPVGNALNADRVPQVTP